MREILDFITEFSKYGTEVKDCFTTGNCYWFAVILNMRFLGRGEIYYYPVMNHFVFHCYEDSQDYDITGLVKTEEKSVAWLDYDQIDPVEWLRIERYCVYKNKDE